MPPQQSGGGAPAPAAGGIPANETRLVLSLPASELPPLPYAGAMPTGSVPPSAPPAPLGATATIASFKLTTTLQGTRAVTTTVFPLGAPACTSAQVQARCVVGIALAPGSYTATVQLYANPGASGTPLAPPTTLAFSVGTRAQSTVALAIGTPPAAVAITSSSYAVVGAQASGFTFYSTAAQTLTVDAVDGSGDVIVGPGAPTFTATINGVGWQVTPPSSTSPNTLTVTAPSADNGSATLAVSAQYSDQTCAQPGAVCSGSAALTNDLELLMVANCTANCNGKSGTPVPGSVTIYAPPYTGAPTAIVLNGVVQPNALLTDAGANLYVSNAFGGVDDTGSVTIYAPPYTGAPTTITAGIDNPGALALDASGNLWVANQAGSGNNGTVTEYAPPFTAKPIRRIASFPGVPTGIALDAQGDLFVATGSSLYEYPVPYGHAPVTLISGLAIANGIAFDASGNLIYADSNGNVQLFAPPYDGPPTQLPRINGTLGLLAAYPGAGAVFIPDGSGNIAEFVTPYTSAPQVIQAGNPNARGITVDAAGDVFVTYCGSGCGNSGNDTVSMFVPPYTAAPIAITSGVAAPSAITIAK